MKHALGIWSVALKVVRSILAAVLPSLSLAAASEVPEVHPPAICKLEASLAGSDGVLIRWGGGTPPFVVLRGDAENFTAARQVEVLAVGVPVRHYRDQVETGKRYWYQVSDRHSPPRIFRIEPRDPHEGDFVTIHGIGFARACKANHLILEGLLDAAPLEDCTATSVKFRVPHHAVSGGLEVMTENGVGGFESTFDDCEGIPRGPVTWPRSP